MDARVAVLRGRPREAFDALMATARTDFTSITSEDELVATPRAHLALADAGLAIHESPVPLQILDAVATRHGAWRYACRVLTMFTAATAEASSLVPTLFVEKFLESFGNDFDLWAGIRRVVPAGAASTAPLLARLAGEVAALPHDWMAWAALASALGGERHDALAEVRRRTVEQCRLEDAR